MLSPFLARFASPEALHSADPRKGSPVWPPAWIDTRERELESWRAGEGREASWLLSAQNWEALLGSHCSRRTMDGSLLAPRMNSSRDSLPAGRRKGCE